jgi:hypothetical protein
LQQRKQHIEQAENEIDETHDKFFAVITNGVQQRALPGKSGEFIRAETAEEISYPAA